VPVAGSEQQLHRLVGNLLDNAVRHARAGVEVRVEVRDGPRPGGPVALVHVLDDGPGVAEEDAERVFERFTRLQEHRGRGTGGAGLGLAIARAVARGHGGDVRVASSRPDDRPGAHLVVELPLATAAW
jgi:signal transduction histidine kinase